MGTESGFVTRLAKSVSFPMPDIIARPSICASEEKRDLRIDIWDSLSPQELSRKLTGKARGTWSGGDVPWFYRVRNLNSIY